MPCDRYIELISARLDGELDPAGEQTLLAHLDTCPRCRALADDFGLLRTAVQELSVPAPEELSAGVLRRMSAPRRSRRVLPRLAALAACALLTVGIVRMAQAPHTPAVADPGAVMARTGDNAPMPMSVHEPDHYSFDQPRTTRVTWGSTPAAPAAVIICSRDHLEAYLAQFPQDDLSALAQAWDEEAFASHHLLAVLVEANSGSITHALDPQGLTWDSVTVRRTSPQVQTCDMAAWLLTARVDRSLPDGHSPAVVFAD